MCEIEYRNRTISSLVSELNSLGHTSTLLKPLTLLAVQREDHPAIRRFKNRDNHQFYLTDSSERKYYYDQVLSEVDGITINNVASHLGTGFKVTIVMMWQLERVRTMFKELRRWFRDGGVYRLVECGVDSKIVDVIERAMAGRSRNTGMRESDKSRVSDRSQSKGKPTANSQNTQVPSNKSCELTQKQYLDGPRVFYRFRDADDFLSLLTSAASSSSRSSTTQPIRIITLSNDSTPPISTLSDSPSPPRSELNLILLPADFLNSDQPNNMHLSTIKSQVSQIFSYIKTHPSKRYQQISKVLTKRHPVTNILNRLLLVDTANYVFNWIEGSEQQAMARFEFFERIHGVSNLMRANEAEQTATMNTKVVDYEYQEENRDTVLKNRSVSNGSHKTTPLRNQPAKSISGKASPFPSPILQLNNSKVSPAVDRNDEKREIGDLEYCRSFQRKTHQYSISPELWGNSHEDVSEEAEQLFGADTKPIKQKLSPQPLKPVLDPQQLQGKSSPLQPRNNSAAKCESQRPRSDSPAVSVSQNPEVSVLKAQHAAEIYQYHNTIQTLNLKLLAMAKENALEELYSIHERELQLLEFKIQQLRATITTLTDHPQEKHLRSVIRKLNEELKLREGKEANAKVMIGKMRVIEKLAHEWENKCRELEKTNKKLSGELESLTKVLEARGKWNEQQGLLNIDKQSDGTMTTLPAVTTNTMSQADRQLLEECSTLVEGIAAGRANCGEFLIRKISGILREYSTSRESVLSCSDFLVQMMQHLQGKLSTTMPQIVLDCNKFIRGFLIDTLNIL